MTYVLASIVCVIVFLFAYWMLHGHPQFFAWRARRWIRSLPSLPKHHHKRK